MFPTFTKAQLDGDKPLELAVHRVFIPTALMVSFTLALLVTILIIIDVWKASKAIGKTCITLYINK